MKIQDILSKLDPTDLLIDSNGEIWVIGEIDCTEDGGDFELRGDTIRRYDKQGFEVQPPYGTVRKWDPAISRLSDEFHGMTGAHTDLANCLEAAGFLVEMNPENNERSQIRVHGSDLAYGEIRGDAEAEIVVAISEI